MLALAGVLAAKDLVLPPGTTELDAPMVLEAAADGLHVMGAPGGSTLKASAKFQGEALLVARGIKNVTIERVKFDGNRQLLDRRFPIAPYNKSFAEFYPLNGVLIEQCEGVILRDLELRNVVNFPVLVSRSKQVRLQTMRIEYSGSRDEKGRNNTTGGILLEDGTSDFEVRFVKLRAIRGNGIWTHSRYERPRNRDGLIQENEVNGSARDAIQIGHATNVRVLQNVMANIGYPADLIDVEHGGIPVGIDTAGNVDNSLYAGNLMQEINGKCIDLDGFHDGEVRANRCFNRKPAAAYPQGHFGIVMNNTNPDMQSRNILIEENEIEGMKFGGIFVIGRGHVIRKNRMRYLNMASCTESHGKGFECYFGEDEPDLLRSGIYLGKGAERPDRTRDVVIENNLITGYKMKERCVGHSPLVDTATVTIQHNICVDVDPEMRGKQAK